MLYTVNYTKKNSFMRFKSEPRLVNKNADGEVVNESRYVKPGVSKALKVYVPKIHFRKNTMQVDLSQKELDELVKAMELYDDNNQIITSAPKRNPNAPFWNHPETKLMLETSGTTFDDSNPRDAFWLACFRADPNFRFAGDNIPPSVASRVLFTVTKAADAMNDVDEKADEAFEAMERLIAMQDDPEKMAKILRAMGTTVRGDLVPKRLRATLQRKITEYKDAFVKGTSERNVEMFMRLSGGNSSELEMKSIINEAMSYDIIGKKQNGKYVYGDIELGTSLNLVESFLSDEENKDLLSEIIKKTKDGDSRTNLPDPVQ